MTERLKSTIENTGEVLESAREQLTDNIENKLERARSEKEKPAESSLSTTKQGSKNYPA